MVWRDAFTRQAKKEGYKARSVWKLKELDKKYQVFKKRDNVVDLGCYPGSWLKYAKQQVGTGTVIGIDLKTIPKLKEDVIFLKKDIFDLTQQDIQTHVDHVDVVLSDMAPSTTGIRDVDQNASIDLAQQAFEVAKELDASVFVCKYFQGPDSDEFIRELRQYFEKVKSYKPKSSRGKSIEMYVVCKK